MNPDGGLNKKMVVLENIAESMEEIRRFSI
jgi:hypothetical protein